jgi:MFS family permease
LFSKTDVATPYWDLVVFMAALGAGVGAFSSPNISSIMSAVPAHRRGIASAVRATLFNVGFALSLNITILLMAAVMPYNAITQIITTSNVSLIPDVDRELFVHAIQNAYLWLALINVIALIPSLLGGIARMQEPRIETTQLSD